MSTAQTPIVMNSVLSLALLIAMIRLVMALPILQLVTYASASILSLALSISILTGGTISAIVYSWKLIKDGRPSHAIGLNGTLLTLETALLFLI